MARGAKGFGKDKGKGGGKGKGSSDKGKGKGKAEEPLSIKESRVDLNFESREEVLDLIHRLRKERGDPTLAQAGQEAASTTSEETSESGSSEIPSDLDLDDLPEFDSDDESDDDEVVTAKHRSKHRQEVAKKRWLQQMMDSQEKPEKEALKTGSVRVLVLNAAERQRRPQGPVVVPRGGGEMVRLLLKRGRRALKIKGGKDLYAYLLSPSGKVEAKVTETGSLVEGQVVAISHGQLAVSVVKDAPVLPAHPSKGKKEQSKTHSDEALLAVRAAYAKRAETGAWAEKALAELSPGDADALNRELSARASAYESDDAYWRLREQRQNLPAAWAREELVNALKVSQVVLVVGETGSGKSTQCPNFILEDAVWAGRGAEVAVVCVQPRRIAATSLAERVATERGEEPGDVVGHAVRLHSSASWKTRLLFCTPGVLLQRLNVSPNLAGITHVVVDEAHERSLHTDFILLLLREVLDQRADLRVVVMSATLEKGLFARYFEGYAFDPSDDLPVVHIHGRTFPLTLRYIDEARSAAGLSGSAASRRRAESGGGHEQGASHAELEAWIRSVHAAGGEDDTLISPEVKEKPDYELIAGLCAAILRGDLGPQDIAWDDGAILIFLPGYVEIERCMKELKEHPGIGEWAWVLPLHGSMPINQQQLVFQRPKTLQVRKIVVATNVAETSITIDDVSHVIDSGHVRETRYDPHSSMQVFSTCWVSMAAASQRAGRASRSRPGVCWRLYEQSFLETKLPKHTLCEMRRTALEELVLQLRLLRDEDDVAELLQKAPEPPSKESVAWAVKGLASIGALRSVAGLPLTPLGFHLAHMPVDARTGKMLVYGALCRCLGPMLTIAACLAHRSPFIRSFGGAREKAQQQAREDELAHYCSDHLAVIAAYDSYQSKTDRAAQRELCDRLGLSSHVLDGMAQLRKRFLLHLAETGFASERADGGKEANEHSGNLALVRCVLCAGLFPNVVQVQRERGRIILVSRELEKCHVHPGSLNCRQKSSFAANSGWLLFHSKAKTTQIYLQDSTLVGSIPLLLFGGDLCVDSSSRHMELVDLPFRSKKPETVTLIRLLREEIDRLLLLKVADPKANLAETATPLLATLAKLLELEGSSASGLYGGR